MAAEAGILGGDERRHDGRDLVVAQTDVQRRIGRIELVVLHVGAVLHEEGAEHLAVLGVDFRRQVALGVFQLLERRHPAEDADGRQQQQKAQQHEGCEGHNPEPADGPGRHSDERRTRSRLFVLCHKTEFCGKGTNFSQKGSPNEAVNHMPPVLGRENESLTVEVAEAGMRKTFRSKIRSPPTDQMRRRVMLPG